MLCAALAAVFWPEKPEPVYNGKKLSEWLDQAAAQNGFDLETTHAIQVIGTNGIPFYLRCLSYRAGLFYRVERTLAVPARRWLNVQWQPGVLETRRALFSYLALMELGERAAPAIPKLLAYAKRAPDPQQPSSMSESQTTVVLLGYMGRPGMVAYLSLVTNQDARMRAFAIGQAATFYRNFYLDPEVATEFKRRSLEDPDLGVRVAATNALKQYDPWAKP
jgi:hypothetical protein